MLFTTLFHLNKSPFLSEKEKIEVKEHVILFISYCIVLFKGKMLDNIFPASIHANKAVFDLICERQEEKAM